jgi:hypothetical protein
VVGRLDAPLLQAAGREDSLARAIAARLLRCDERLDWAYVGPGDLWNQPARDGVHAYLGAGDVTLAQVLRLTPLCGARSAWGGQLVAAELPAEAAEAAVDVLAGAGAAPGVVARRPRRPRRRGTVTLALSPFSAAAASRPPAAEPAWRPIGATWRDGLLAAVAR